jgi:hypothetical protein
MKCNNFDIIIPRRMIFEVPFGNKYGYPKLRHYTRTRIDNLE